MKRTQWIVFGVAILATIGLYAASEKQFFGRPKTKHQSPPATAQNFSADSILHYAKQVLSPEQLSRVNLLESQIVKATSNEDRIHLYHQIARFWRDTAHVFTAYAWNLGQAARLENSEKSLTFAARLFLDSLVEAPDPRIRQWESVQARDLFERSLKLAPGNDSSKIGLGEVLVYGGLALPMEGIGKIREVAARDSGNVYAQMSLGRASLVSGQLDKAADYFKKAASLQPANLEAIFRAAELSEQLGNKPEAVKWYGKLLPLVNRSDIKKDIETRINELKK